MAGLIVLLCLAAPPLLMWWMVRVQRRVREQMRETRRDEVHRPPVVAYVDAEIGPDGLAYGRAVAGDPPQPEGLTPEIDGIRALTGRR